MTSRIERLRALEKKWRELAEKSDSIDLPQNGQIFRWCAEDISSLIAELGQEVGAVDDAEAQREFTECFVKNYPGPHTVIMDPTWHAPKIFRAAKRALRTSPAHTSEARDAVVKGVRELAIKATAHWDAKFDDAALDVARRFTLDTEPQRRASLHVAIVEAMHRASNRSQS